MIDIPFSEKFSENMDRTNSHGRYPCIVCGCNAPHAKNWVHAHCGLSTIVTEEEAGRLNTSGEECADMGMWPVGNDCLKQHPELLPYIQRIPTIKASDWKALFFDIYRQTCGNEEASEEECLQEAYRRLALLKVNAVL